MGAVQPSLGQRASSKPFRLVDLFMGRSWNRLGQLDGDVKHVVLSPQNLQWSPNRSYRRCLLNLSTWCAFRMISHF